MGQMAPAAHATSAALGVHKPRCPQASPLFRLVQDQLHRVQTVYDERFAREYGPWRPVVGEVTDKFLACGMLEHGFARIRCDACAHEYLLAFSCKCRYFCPSCHAKRLALWAQWFDTTLLAPVPHRQVVLTIPKRLRAYCLYRRRLLGEIARVAACTVTAVIRTLTGERDLAIGIVACLQTHGSRANWHPHLHLLVTDGGFRADGTFVPWPALDTARVTEAFRRAVLRLFVRLDLFDEDQAAGMLTWPHSGFHVHTAVWVPEDDRAFATRLARYYRLTFWNTMPRALPLPASNPVTLPSALRRKTTSLTGSVPEKESPLVCVNGTGPKRRCRMTSFPSSTLML